MNRIVVALAAFSFAILGASCGQSGPLYIPGNPSTIQTPPTAQDQAEEEKEENGDNDEKQ